MASLAACASSQEVQIANSGWTICILPSIPVTAHAISDGLIQLSPSSVAAKPEDGLDALLDSIGAQYPEIAKKAGVDGKIVVDFQVNEYGVVSEVEWVKSIGARTDETVEQILRGTVFEPGMIDDQPVASRLRLPFEVEFHPIPREIEVPALPLQTYTP